MPADDPTPGAGSRPARPVPPPESRWRLIWARSFAQVSAYLPLVLMAMLAVGSWWLVKNTPLLGAPPAAAPPRHDPDYTMTVFMVQRFNRDGSLQGQIEGDLLRHYPDTDTLEIDNARIRSIAPDGRVTVATARRALTNADGSEVQLLGGAHVVRQALGTDPAVEFTGEFLHAFLRTERVRSHLPVVVRQSGSEVHADGLAYDNLARVLELKGSVRATLPARVPRR